MRQADEIFLQLARARGCLSRRDAAEVEAELARLDREGTPSKARLLCLELGFIDRELARELKREVRVELERRLPDSRNLEGSDILSPTRTPPPSLRTPPSDATRSVSPHAVPETEADAMVLARSEEGSRGQRRIAGFEIIERLGAGAMGVVFKARHLRLDVLVALKVMNPELARDARYVARFTQEAQCAARLNHPNIVKAQDVGCEGDLHYIAMEFVEGKTVKDMIERRGQLDPTAAVGIVLQVVDALHHAHSNNLVHRDIKPANIMITREGQAKLLDLGLAKRTDVENGLTGEGRAIGTPYFMAPEAALDKGYDYRTDIYSLGVTLFNMVTGAKPYEAGTPVAVMQMHLKAPVPDARERNPNVPEGLGKVIKRMMAKRPADRYQDHALLVADLEAVLRGLSPELKLGQVPEGIEYIKPRGPAPRTGKRAAVEQTARGQAPSRGKKSPLPLVGAGAAAALALAVGLVLFSGPRTSAQTASTDQVAAGVNEEPQAQSGREERARAALAEAPSQGGPARADELAHVAHTFAGTAAGKEAERELAQYNAQRAEERRRDFEGRMIGIQEMAGRGELHPAKLECEILADLMDEDAELQSRARARASELAAEITRRLSEAEGQVEKHLAAAQEPEAARLLRATKSLRPEEEHAGIDERIADMKARHVARQDAAAEKDRSASEARTRAAEESVVSLPARLRELVQQGKGTQALALARSTADAVEDRELLLRVKRHVEALEALARVGTLADEAFQKLVGQPVELERHQGKELKGTLVRANSGKLTVAISAGAELTIDLSDLAESELPRAIRRAHGQTPPAFVHAWAALKVYRGDPDAVEQLAKARAAGIDLAAVAEELRQPAAEEEVKALVAEGAVADRDQPVDDGRAEQERFRRQDEMWRGRARLFPDGQPLGVADAQFHVVWVFQGRKSFNKDWSLQAGKAFPTPPGQEFRDGLVLEGKGGRAELTAPLAGDASVKLQFQPQMISQGEGRFALTLDDANGARVVCDLGQLQAWKKRKQVGVAGERAITKIRAKQDHELELVRRADDVIVLLDGQEAARLGLDASFFQGPIRLGLEWSHAALNLLAIEIQAEFDPTWMDKRLAGSVK